MSELASIVLDNGTGFVKCGFSCDDVPEQIIPTIYSPADKKIGKEAMFSEDLEFPMARGMVQNWDRMELIWSKLFKLLKVDSKEYNVHFSDAVLNPKPNREKMAQLFFEKYQVQGVAFSNSGALTTFATGRTSGLAFESGHGLTAVSPIFEGYAIAQGTFRSELAGQDVNALLAERLKVTGYRTLQNVKEQCCYIGENEHTNAEAMAFSLPDGSSLTIDKERTLCPEVLFNPEMEGLENLPVHKLIATSISKCDIDIRRTMYSNIIISGGTTLFSNFVDRVDKYLNTNTPDNMQVVIDAPAERKYLPWIGGCMLAGLGSFEFVSKKKYEEMGNAILHQ